MISTRRKLWNVLMFSITGVAACWNPICQGSGLPREAASAGAAGEVERSVYGKVTWRR